MALLLIEQTNMQHGDYKELLELARAVVPKTWNVWEYCDIKNFKKERGILNIELHIYNEPLDVRRPNTLGHVGGIQYLNGIASCKISIHCYPPMRTENLLHELAHIAVFRLQSLMTKSYKAEFDICGGDIIEPDSHGEIFYKLFNILENRAIKKGWNFFVIKDRKIWSKDTKGSFPNS